MRACERGWRRERGVRGGEGGGGKIPQRGEEQGEDWACSSLWRELSQVQRSRAPFPCHPCVTISENVIAHVSMSLVTFQV